MAEHDHSHEETPAQKAEREARERAEQKRLAEQQASGDHQKGEDGIFASIIGYIKFLFDKLLSLFSPDRNAPDEEEAAPGAPPPRTQSTGELIRIGKSVVTSGAISKWKEFQRTHRGEKVEFDSPLIGGGTVNSNFGMRDLHGNGQHKHHDGVDMIGPDKRIGAAAGGVVLFSNFVKGYGNMVVVGHSDGRYTLYGHMTGELMPSLGQEVARGQQIGVMGRTGGGDVTGTHLHFEVLEGDKPVQPIINGVAVAKGATVMAARSAQDDKLADLARRSGVRPLAADVGGESGSLAFAPGASVKAAAVRGG